MFGADTKALFDFTCLNKNFQKDKSQFSHSRSLKPPLKNYFYFGFCYKLSDFLSIIDIIFGHCLIV